MLWIRCGVVHFTTTSLSVLPIPPCLQNVHMHGLEFIDRCAHSPIVCFLLITNFVWEVYAPFLNETSVALSDLTDGHSSAPTVGEGMFLLTRPDDDPLIIAA